MSADIAVSLSKALADATKPTAYTGAGMSAGSPPRYLLKSVSSSMRAYGGFLWPRSVGVRVAAPDWDPTPRCGGGLHGALNGAGEGWLFNWDADAVWIVARIPDDAGIVDLGEKIKVSHCETVAVGTRKEATGWLADRGFSNIIGVTLGGGIRSTLVGGFRSTLTGGAYSTLIGGEESTVIGVGYNSVLVGGTASSITGGDYSNIVGGGNSILVGGDSSTLTGGRGSTYVAGDKSVFIERRWREHLITAHVGRGSLTPGVRYRVNDGFFVPAEERLDED